MSESPPKEAVIKFHKKGYKLILSLKSHAFMGFPVFLIEDSGKFKRVEKEKRNRILRK